ncbi:FAD-binding oxidoreductase [Streptomyces sp. Q6]|uniref:FAD-binding oxidoreductase n=1 Tax=Streptomyces citrinus TaxID=3118173 RepID=A0ACD5APW5_9ACTN
MVRRAPLRTGPARRRRAARRRDALRRPRHRTAARRRTGHRGGRGERRTAADTVVNCAGPGADRLAALAGVRLPLRRVPGLVAESRPLPGGPLTAILTAPGIDLRPTPDGGVLSLSWEVDARLDGTALDGLPQELHERATTIVPALRAAPVADARIGVRPVPVDGLPLIGEALGAPGLYHLVSHSGVTLAPVLGRLAAQEITTGGTAPELAAYRPDRRLPGDVHDENLRAMNARGPNGQVPDHGPGTSTANPKSQGQV